MLLYSHRGVVVDVVWEGWGRKEARREGEEETERIRRRIRRRSHTLWLGYGLGGRHHKTSQIHLSFLLGEYVLWPKD